MHPTPDHNSRSMDRVGAPSTPQHLANTPSGSSGHQPKDWPLARLAAIRSLDGSSFGLIIEALDIMEHDSKTSKALKAMASFEKHRLWSLYEEAKAVESTDSTVLMERAQTGTERREAERRSFKDRRQA